MKYDFSGYATKNGLKCTDGRVILKDAFKHQDGQTVPLVWQHLHNDPANVLGHAVLENRRDGVYCYGKFNDTDAGRNARELVAHGDISALSIYANQLKEQARKVMHGAIREVSLVLSGANPEALIDNLSFAHGDDYETDMSEAIIYTGLSLAHTDKDDEDSDDEDDKGETVKDVFDTLSEKQKTVVYAMIAKALEEGESKEAKHADGAEGVLAAFDGLDDGEQEAVVSALAHMTTGGQGMKTNVFEQGAPKEPGNVLSHAQMAEILGDAKRFGSLKESFVAHAADYGFDPIDILFPDAKNAHAGGPQQYKRNDDWVSGVLADTNHTPFSRIKTVIADLTHDEARAKGYVTGNRKKEEIIPLMKRVTTPTTIYKKQKLDRDDLLDITEFDVVVWLKAEMRTMLNEELARAILIGDGRDISDEDKINEQNLRPIALDDGDVFLHRARAAADLGVDGIIDEFIRARKHYKGSGSPALYASTELVTEMLLVKDGMGRRLYSNAAELASVLRVSKIVEVEPMNGARRVAADGSRYEILGIVVNLKDYTVGADKGGQVSMFDDFDIDYNQQKYLIETRVSGALTRPKSAIVMERKMGTAVPAEAKG